MSDPCLTKPCDSCGKRIQGGYYDCPRCKICFCFYCGMEMVLKQRKVRIEYPMCGETLKQ